MIPIQFSAQDPSVVSDLQRLALMAQPENFKIVNSMPQNNEGKDGNIWILVGNPPKLLVKVGGVWKSIQLS